MSEWHFTITSEAEEDLQRLDNQSQQRVAQKLAWLVKNFDQLTPFPLSEPYKGFFKLRVGDWRVFYEIDNDKKTVIIHMIDRRDKIYKR